MLEALRETEMRAEQSGESRHEVLNLGCGRKRVEGAINLDVTHATGPDVLHDLNRRPWPFPDGKFAEVIAHDVIEHLDDVLATFEEIHRVCRDGASVKIAVPHFSSGNAFTDPTHRHFFGYFTLDCLTEEDERSFYTRARFRYRHRQIIFWPTLLNKIVYSYDSAGKQTGYSVFDASGKLVSRTGGSAPRPSPSPKSREKTKR